MTTIDKTYSVAELDAIRLQLIDSPTIQDRRNSIERVKGLMKYARFGTKIKAQPGSDLFVIINRLFMASLDDSDDSTNATIDE